MLKQYVELNAHKIIEAEKNGGKDRKVLHKLMNMLYMEKKMENLRNWINVKPVSNKKDYLKWTSKLNYMSHKIFGNDLVTKHKNKVKLTLKKPAYIEICILEWSKVLM